MKTRRMTFMGLAIAVALLAAPAMYAQQGFNSELGIGRWSAVEPAVSAAYAENGYFNAEIGSVPQPDEFSFWTMRAEVATDAGEGSFVEVSEIIEDDYVPEGQSVYVLVTRRVPARTPGSEIALRGK